MKLVTDHWRGMDFYKPDSDRNGHVVVVGAGSIGSYATYALARIGVPKITVIDFDTVENHNLPNQFFAESLELTEGILKVIALQSTVKMMVKDANIKILPSRIEDLKLSEYLPCTALFICVDDMDVRRRIFENKDIQSYSDMIVDARVGGLYANIFWYRPIKTPAKEFYKSTLHSNAEAAPLPCTGQAIADVAMCVAAEMVARYRTTKTIGSYPSLHTFYDYKYGQAWIQEANKNFSDKTPDIITTNEVISAVGMQPIPPTTREEVNSELVTVTAPRPAAFPPSVAVVSESTSTDIISAELEYLDENDSEEFPTNEYENER